MLEMLDLMMMMMMMGARMGLLRNEIGYRKNKIKELTYKISN